MPRHINKICRISEFFSIETKLHEFLIKICTIYFDFSEAFDTVVQLQYERIHGVLGEEQAEGQTSKLHSE